MTDSQNETQIEQGNTDQQHADGSTVLVKRGTKSLPKGTQATVLGYDSVTDSYAVRIDGDPVRYTNVKAGYVGPVPERTFTESEVADALTEAVDSFGGAAVTPKDVNRFSRTDPS